MAEVDRRNGKEAGFVQNEPASMTFEMLVQRFGSTVLGVCIANTKNLHDSEDIMQEVFLRAFRKFKTLRDPGRARPWLLKIARRMCIDFHHKRSAAQPMPGDMPAKTNPSDERIEYLQRAIARLPEGYREPIALYYLDGRNCAGVARTLGISEDAVRSRLVRARLRLHEILSEDKL